MHGIVTRSIMKNIEKVFRIPVAVLNRTTMQDKSNNGPLGKKKVADIIEYYKICFTYANKIHTMKLSSKKH